ncbi:MAG: hypothetical protein IT262_04535 [Saprospiraceae bacterium]|nr:hypothetical protein [Saprospiraceae bacterium]
MKIFLPVLLLLVSASALTAQWNTVIETERVMSFGSRPCFRMEFTNTAAGTVEDMWKDFAKKNFGAKLKKDKKSGEWTATGLKSSMMGDDAFSIYSTIEKNDANAAINIWFDAGTYFLSRRDNPGRAEEVSRALRQFYIDVRREAIANELKAEEDKLKDLDKKQKSMQKENDGLRKDIESWKAKIVKAEDDIVKNEREQEQNLVNQEAQRRAIEAVRQRLNNVENERN